MKSYRGRTGANTDELTTEVNALETHLTTARTSATQHLQAITSKLINEH